ncbi:phosphonate C-P lyase system protein PhnG [Meridianimarinicoccus aquatilis]|uniref:Phosphonate C-P lyase system protein PhnG n=1 Tax=Meridianimarinicoccus aquatilis TaxID=2552766 RepID=A0A4R6ANX8_9RHOB|nr:phosphonate C-P lyase system protein PhnG [Fluviibacterium aquatile]QIE43166.1 phosphonate C-P lyase system protein PhnG [Rhodobacteraceae bacterium SC52]TDL85152.1 phosphonate C-P lyase system protein PhnG [Fluviibacterium aquatile]
MFDVSTRQGWMGLLARAPSNRVSHLWANFGPVPAHETLRSPEIGAVMVRGRAGATGAPFNLGEMTVTRCTVSLACGTIGHGYVQGRNKAHAETAALIDALMQTNRQSDLRKVILEPLAAEMEDARTTRAAKAAATKVEFFTLVRGED